MIGVGGLDLSRWAQHTDGQNIVFEVTRDIPGFAEVGDLVVFKPGGKGAPVLVVKRHGLDAIPTLEHHVDALQFDHFGAKRPTRPGSLGGWVGKYTRA